MLADAVFRVAQLLLDEKKRKIAVKIVAEREKKVQIAVKHLKNEVDQLNQHHSPFPLSLLFMSLVV